MGGWGEHLYLQLEVEEFGGGDAGNVTVHGTWDSGEQIIAWRRAHARKDGPFFCIPVFGLEVRVVTLCR